MKTPRNSQEFDFQDYDFELKSGQNTPSLRQLEDFQPEAFDKERFQEKIFAQLDSYLEKNADLRHSDEFKNFLDTLKSHLRQIVTSSFEQAELKFELRDKEFSTLNANSLVQNKVVDVILKNSDQILEKLSELFEYIRKVSFLARHITQLKARIIDMERTICSAHENEARIKREEEGIIEEDVRLTQSGEHNLVALQKINSKVEALGKRKKTATEKIRKKEAQLELAKKSLNKLAAFLEKALKNGLNSFPSDEELRRFAQGMDVSMDENSLRAGITDSLSEPYSLNYRALDTDKKRKEDFTRGARAVIRSWEFRLSILGLLVFGGLTGYKKIDSYLHRCHEDISGQCEIPEDHKGKLDEDIIKILETYGIYTTYQLNAGFLTKSDSIDDQLDPGSEYNVNSEKYINDWRQRMLEHPFVKKYFTHDQIAKINSAKSISRIDNVMTEVINYFSHDKNWHHDLIKDIYRQHIKPDVGTMKPKRMAPSLEIWIPEELIRLFKEKYGDADLNFSIIYDDSAGGKDYKANLYATKKMLFALNNKFCRNKSSIFILEGSLVLPGNFHIPLPATQISKLDIPENVHKEICKRIYDDKSSGDGRDIEGEEFGEDN